MPPSHRSSNRRVAPFSPMIPLLTAGLFGGCGGVRASTRPVSSPTPAVASAPAAAAEAPVAEAPAAVADGGATPETARCETWTEECTRAALPGLVQAFARVEAAPSEAMEVLRANRSPAARAWVAYLSHHAGDDAGATATLDALAAEGEAAGLAPSNASPGARALFLIREQAENLSGGDTDLVGALPCVVFRWDPAEARDAFAPAHGSNRDTIIAPFKRRCVTAGLEAGIENPVRGRVAADIEAVTSTLFLRWPVPESGTLWTAEAISAREVMLDAMLGLPPRPENGERPTLALIGRLNDGERNRLMTWRRDVEARIGGLIIGMRALARGRGAPMMINAADLRVRAATLGTFTRWVGALHPRGR